MRAGFTMIILSQPTSQVSARIYRMTKSIAESRARTNRIGRHLPTSNGLMNTLRTSRELELETLQIFVSNPQGWGWPKPRPDGEAFAQAVQELGLFPVIVHSTYL